MTSRTLPCHDVASKGVQVNFTAKCGLAEVNAVKVGTDGVKTRFGDIIKSSTDHREYRGIELTNNLKVLLISDSTTDKSAAALDVNVGYLSDPDDLPGLAHFCEHMLFLGTKKYPQENAYNKYLSEHGGACNASTSTDHTNYYFDILPQHLQGALDIFAQFFISPLFTESATERELNAVDSEHDKNRSSDSWRIDQLNKSTADPSHPYSKFGTGNRDTLETTPREKGVNVREELLKFHSKWYSANIMTVVVYGKESLDELENLVVPLFSAVENKKVEAPYWHEHPFPPKLRRKRAQVVPIKDLRNLHINFPIPDLTEYYQSSPAGYLSHLLGHEGPGSLLSALRNRGWCNSLSAGPRTVASGFGFFSVNVDLTEEGVDHTDDIVKLMFQYIELVKREGPKQWIFEEQKNLNNMHFRFKDASEPRSLVVSCAHNMQEFPVEHVLSAHYLLGNFEPELIKEILAHLSVDNVRIAALAQKFSDKCKSTEKWYGTKHNIEDIPKELIQEWKTCEPIEELFLPPPNEFIPSNLLLEARENPVCVPGAVIPTIVRDGPKLRLWYRQDNEFLLPKACVNFDFVSPLAYAEPLSCNANAVWVLLLKDSLVEYAYAAELAGLFWFISATKYGFTVGIDGFDDKQHVLLEKMIDKVINFKADPKRFEIMKEAHQRTLKNMEAEQPYQHALYHQALSLSHLSWGRELLLQTAGDLTIEYLEEYAHRMMRRVHVEGLVFGNLTKDRALNFATLIENKLPQDGVPLLAQHLLLNREIELGKGTFFLREVECSVHRSSCACLYYPCGLQSTRGNVILELLALVLHEPCFNTLRTKEQLGYIVFSGLRRSVGVQGLRIIVQSNRHPLDVDGRIEAFLAQMKKIISELSDAELEKYKSSLSAQKLERPKRMGTRFSQMWSEISSQQYNFDKNRIEVAELESVTKCELLAFYEKHIWHGSRERQKLSVYVVSTAPGGAEGEAEEIKSATSCNLEDLNAVPQLLTQPVRITDLLDFKASRRLYPNLPPYMKVPRKGATCKL